jgi:peptidoglycan/LPS O-acetylase OafA/YrhL
MQALDFFRINIDNRRNYGLDILRAFAIIAVLITHSAGFVPPSYQQYSDWLTFDGVTFFFVLSGFLIGGILIKTLESQKADSYTLLDFWVKRWFRTIPPYFLVLSIVMLLTSATDSSFRFTYFKEFYLFLQNLYKPHPAFFREAWSLAVEEWFYLLVPSSAFLLIQLKLKSKSSILTVSLTVLFTVTLYRYYKYMHYPAATIDVWDVSFRKIVATRLDSLMYGVIAAYVHIYYPVIWEQFKRPLFFGGIVCILLGKLAPAIDNVGLYSCVFSFSMTSLGTMILLPGLYSIRHGKGIIFKMVTYTSLISYSLYLLNGTIVVLFIVFPLLQKLHIHNGTKAYYVGGYLAFWFFSFLLAIPLYKYFEMPVMRLRHRFVAHSRPRTT